MQGFNIGDRVRHKLADITLTITKLSDTVAVCRRDKPEITKFGMEVWTAICQYENLEHEKEEKTRRQTQGSRSTKEGTH